MLQQYTLSLFDRLLTELPLHEDINHASSGGLQTLKNAIGKDLEALLNTRMALQDEALAAYPHVARSILNYGLMDFAGMCLSSDTDRKRICAAVKRAIELHEPRLTSVSISLRTGAGSINHIDLCITARLRADPGVNRVHFDAVLEPSTQRYLVSHSRSDSKRGA